MTVASGPNPSPPPTGPALRRLHYKATHRSHLHHNTTATALPKVIVMGTSTTSDVTNNTSTESQATAVTSITVTDDSLDTEPSESNHQIPNLIDSPPPKVPSTAPPGYHREGDFFNSLDYDSPAYTKPQSATDKLDSPRPGPARFIFDVQLPRPIEETKTTANGIQNGTEKLMNAKIDRREKRRESQPALHNASIALRRQFDGVDIFSPGRRKSFQHCVPVSSPRRQSNAAQVHVTANPLDSAATTVVTGRTTIVVQQPSLSLDFGGYTTILLRDGDKSSGRRMSRCHDNLQQLLDVTSQFTHEDLQDFDKRYGSPHHSRSQSVKAVRKTDRHLLGLPQQRARVASMPNTGVEEEYYRLRHFSITGKGIVNRGDSLRSRRSRSNTSVASSASSNEHLSRTSAPCSLASSRDSSAGISSYRVLVLGSTSVGKSSLIGQFMTSEYLHAYDTSIDDESGERSVCVLLAGEESEITFLDSPSENVIRDGSAHGYCIVYSTSDRDSFEAAEKTLRIVWGSGHTHTKAVILVGNKADLERSRTVPTEEGKNLATSYDSKFIETSVGINHNVDELLVGLLTQIRLKQQQSDKARKRATRKPRTRNRSPHEIEPINTQIQLFNGNSSATNSPTKRGRLSGSVKVRGLLGKVWPRDSKSKSCENLHVL